MALALTLGPVAFQDFEVPSTFGPLGGTQIIVKHDFPGGAITHQSLGVFPPVAIRWNGILTGATAFQRHLEIDHIRANAQEVVLAYGPFSYSGRVAAFDAIVRHQFLIDYTILFEPRVDQSGTSGVSISGGVFSADTALAGQLLSFNNVVIGATTGITMPIGLSAVAGNLSDAVANGLGNGDGSVAGISGDDSTTIQASVVALQKSATRYLDSDDAGLASAAADLFAFAGNIGQTIASVTSALVVLRQQVNPNLFQLGVQYFADSTQWLAIASASGLNDPLPVGIFDITIPATVPR